MSEEQVAEDSAVEEIEEVEEQSEETKQSESEIERIAVGMGWQKNYKGDPDKFVDAETYIRRTHDVNSSLRKQLKEIGNVVNELKSHNERVYKAEVRRLEGEIATLKAERRTAIENGDVDRVDELDKKIDESKAAVDEGRVAIQTAPTNNPVWDEWLEENGWYNSDKEMKRYADNMANEYDGLPFPKILKLVKKDVMAEFPDKFATKTASKKATPGATVEGAAKRTASKTSASDVKLTDAQKKAMKDFEALGVMTRDEYIADLKKMGEI